MTFRSELGDLALLDADDALLTGSDALCSVAEIVAGDDASLTGNTPSVHTEEKVAGLPSYTGASPLVRFFFSEEFFPPRSREASRAPPPRRPPLLLEASRV